MSENFGENASLDVMCSLHCKRIVAGRRRSIILAVSCAGATGVGLCLHDIILLSITRISGRGLS